MGFSQFPSTGAVGASTPSDFVWFWSGALETGRDHLIPQHVRNVEVDVDTLDAYVESAPTGADIIVDVLVDDVSIGTVTIADGTTSGTTALDPVVTITAGSVVTMEITQVGSGYKGRTLTVYARVA